MKAYLCGLIFLWEWSTLFVHVYQVMNRIGHNKSLFFVVNGLLAVGSFFVVRIALVPFHFYVVARSKGWSGGDLLRLTPCEFMVSVSGDTDGRTFEGCAGLGKVGFWC